MSSTSQVLIPEKASIFKLKVKNGARVQRGSVLCLYRSEKRPEFTEKLRSSKDGIVKSVAVSNGQQVEADTCILSIEQETCLHPIVVKMICADCGLDLKPQFMDSEVKGISANNANLASAKVSMIHNVPELMVSSDIAEDVATKDVSNLLESRKLVLIVDLDQTLIHTTNDDVPSNLKDVHHFQLQQGGAWYHTKLRPGAKEFLEEISKYFELQIITFGVRLYAHIIASILDPDEKLFHHRIMARDEIHLFGNDKTANISSLFPVGDEMVCVIDDRDDVWRYMENVIKVPAYKFFPSTGDINDPLRAQRTQKASSSSSVTAQSEDKEMEDGTDSKSEQSEINGAGDNSESPGATRTVQDECSKDSSVLNSCATNESGAVLNGAKIENDSNNEDSTTETSSEVSTRSAKRVRFSLPPENDEKSNQSEMKSDVDKGNENKKSEMKMDLGKENVKETASNEAPKEVGKCDQTAEEFDKVSTENIENHEKDEIESEKAVKLQLENDGSNMSSEISESMDTSDVPTKVAENIESDVVDSEDKTLKKEPKNTNDENKESSISQETSSSNHISTSGQEDEKVDNSKLDISESARDLSAKIKSHKLGKMGRIPKKLGRKLKDKDSSKSSKLDKSSNDVMTSSVGRGQKKRKRMMLFGDLDICMDCEEGVPHACSYTSMTAREIVEADAELTSEKKTVIKGVELLKTQPIKSARRVTSDSYSQHSQAINSSSVETSQSNDSWEDSDYFLPFLKDILLKVHQKFYEQYDKNKQSASNGESPIIPNVKDVINDTKREALSDCFLVFSAVVPTNFPIANSREYLEAKSLGATVMESMDTKLCTHVVAARQGTHKVHQARKTGKRIKIVNPDWLWSCSQKWIKVDEQEFSLESFDHTKTLKTSWYPSPRNNFKTAIDKQSIEPQKSTQEAKFDSSPDEKLNELKVDDVSFEMCNNVDVNTENVSSQVNENEGKIEKENVEIDPNEALNASLSSENDDQDSNEKVDDFLLNGEHSNDVDISDESESNSDYSNGADENLEDEIALIESALLANINNLESEQTV